MVQRVANAVITHSNSWQSLTLHFAKISARALLPNSGSDRSQKRHCYQNDWTMAVVLKTLKPQNPTLGSQRAIAQAFNRLNKSRRSPVNTAAPSLLVNEQCSQIELFPVRATRALSL